MVTGLLGGGAYQGEGIPDKSGDWVPDKTGDWVPDKSGDWVPRCYPIRIFVLFRSHIGNRIRH